MSDDAKKDILKAAEDANSIENYSPEDPCEFPSPRRLQYSNNRANDNDKEISQKLKNEFDHFEKMNQSFPIPKIEKYQIDNKK